MWFLRERGMLFPENQKWLPKYLITAQLSGTVFNNAFPAFLYVLTLPFSFTTGHSTSLNLVKVKETKILLLLNQLNSLSSILNVEVYVSYLKIALLFSTYICKGKNGKKNQINTAKMPILTKMFSQQILAQWYRLTCTKVCRLFGPSISHHSSPPFFCFFVFLPSMNILAAVLPWSISPAKIFYVSRPESALIIGLAELQSIAAYTEIWYGRQVNFY